MTSRSYQTLLGLFRITNQPVPWPTASPPHKFWNVYRQAGMCHRPILCHGFDERCLTIYSNQDASSGLIFGENVADWHLEKQFDFSSNIGEWVSSKRSRPKTVIFQNMVPTLSSKNWQAFGYMSPASVSLTISIVTPASASPVIIAQWIGAPPRYLGQEKRNVDIHCKIHAIKQRW